MIIPSQIEPLLKDQNENDRMAKSLHVSLSHGGQEDANMSVAHISRCGPLHSYDPVKMTKQVRNHLHQVVLGSCYF